jgi:hypothetical protein
LWTTDFTSFVKNAKYPGAEIHPGLSSSINFPWLLHQHRDTWHSSQRR